MSAANGTSNLPITSAGWKGPIAVDANVQILISHRIDGRFEWCALPRGTALPTDLVGQPLLSDTQRLQNGVQTSFSFNADVYVRGIDKTGVDQNGAAIVIPYTILG